MNHSFNIHIAKQYGLNEAIMISNFQYWILKNRANKTHNHDGRTWTYNSVRAFEELFPYLTSWQVRKCLDSLVEQGVLVKGNYHKNPYERSSWYAFANESMFLYPQDHLCSTSNGNDESHKSITDNKPDGKPNNNTGGDSNSSFPINQVNDNQEHRLQGGRAAAAPTEIDYRGLNESVMLWLEYKAEKKSKYRGAKSIQIMINQLWKKSNGNPERAMAIVENSIANNYQGLFEARENNQDASPQQVKPNSNIKFNIQ
jgi:hypothetical protein